MMPHERHVAFLKRIDTIEAEMFGLYRSLERLRLDLQREWKAFPSGTRWNATDHAASEHSARTVAPAETQETSKP